MSAVVKVRICQLLSSHSPRICWPIFVTVYRLQMVIYLSIANLFVTTVLFCDHYSLHWEENPRFFTNTKMSQSKKHPQLFDTTNIISLNMLCHQHESSLKDFISAAFLKIFGLQPHWWSTSICIGHQLIGRIKGQSKSHCELWDGWR